MIDMKLSEMDKKENEVTSVLEKPDYPYGLRLYLDPDSVKKLNLKEPKIGEKMMLMGIVEVVSINSEDDKISVSLQIKEMDLKSKSDKSAEEVLYK